MLRRQRQSFMNTCETSEFSDQQRIFHALNEHWPAHIKSAESIHQRLVIMQTQFRVTVLPDQTTLNCVDVFNDSVNRVCVLSESDVRATSKPGDGRYRKRRRCTRVRIGQGLSPARLSN